MNRHVYFLGMVISLLLFSASPARADNYQTSVACNYSHTLGDDAIMMFGMPNQAMWHDFFGNMKTNAFTTYETLRQTPGTTCDNLADSSAYWAPALMLPGGKIVRPTYQKTYYQTVNSEQNPLIAFPDGLQLLAGDHHGTGPNDHINFFCGSDQTYTTSADRTCGLNPDGKTVQLDIAIKFPNCWDGKTLEAKPVPPDNKPNAVYSDGNGVCPNDYPKHIPTVNMNVAYLFTDITSVDVANIKLSLDPIMDGNKRIDQWGSIYTAHGDFINGWTADATKFMVERCMNNNYDCTAYMPYSYAEPSGDTYVSNGEDSDKNFGSSDKIIAQGDPSGSDSGNSAEKIALVKYSIPVMPTNYPPEQTALFKYYLRIYGGRSSGTGAEMTYLYPTAVDWDENTVTWNSRPTCDASNYTEFYLDEENKYRDIDVTTVVNNARQAGETQIAFCIGGDQEKTGATYSYGSKESTYPAQLMIRGEQTVVTKSVVTK
jgi:hypothetical protein